MDYKEEAEALAENNIINELYDSWQCQNWGCSVHEFMAEMVKQISKAAMRLADELAQEEEE